MQYGLCKSLKGFLYSGQITAAGPKGVRVDSVPNYAFRLSELYTLVNFSPILMKSGIMFILPCLPMSLHLNATGPWEVLNTAVWLFHVHFTPM